jgi:hypothetical protein
MPQPSRRHRARSCRLGSTPERARCHLGEAFERDGADGFRRLPMAPWPAYPTAGPAVPGGSTAGRKGTSMEPTWNLDLRRTRRTSHLLACSTATELRPKMRDLRRDPARPCEAVKADDGSRTRDLRLGKTTLDDFARSCTRVTERPHHSPGVEPATSRPKHETRALDHTRAVAPPRPEIAVPDATKMRPRTLPETQNVAFPRMFDVYRTTARTSRFAGLCSTLQRLAKRPRQDSNLRPTA